MVQNFVCVCFVDKWTKAITLVQWTMNTLKLLRYIFWIQICIVYFKIIFRLILLQQNIAYKQHEYLLTRLLKLACFTHMYLVTGISCLFALNWIQRVKLKYSWYYYWFSNKKCFELYTVLFAIMFISVFFLMQEFANQYVGSWDLWLRE